MINPSNVVKIVAEHVSGLSLSSTSNASTAAYTNREREIADLLCGVLESVTDSDGNTFEVESTLDYESEDDECENDVDEDDISQEMGDPDWKEEDDDDDKALNEQFSLDYMARAVAFYDEVNPNTGKRRRRWETVKHNFQRIPHRYYISRFRDYLDKHGTMKQKLEKIDDYVFDMFESAREKALAVHDIDLRRWGRRKAVEEHLNDFAASDHWLYNFKHKHNIVSRKITKVSDLR